MAFEAAKARPKVETAQPFVTLSQDLVSLSLCDYAICDCFLNGCLVGCLLSISYLDGCLANLRQNLA